MKQVPYSDLRRIQSFIIDGYTPMNKWKGGRLLMKHGETYHWVRGRQPSKKPFSPH